MNRRRALRYLAAVTAGVFAAPTLAQRVASPPRRLPLPLVQPPEAVPTDVPGAVQPLAPGERLALPLPRLTLTPPPPGLLKVEVASNGWIEAAHAVLLVPAGTSTPAQVLARAQQAVQGTYLARPTLTDVTVSVYLEAEYAGFGGPPPLLTASVPRDRLDAFVTLRPANAETYDRAWFNASAPVPPQRSPSRELERVPIFIGTVAGLARQRVRQLASQLNGGPHGGLFFHGQAARSVAALSFDDAPHPIYAPLLLDTLRRERVQATFFCIGRNARVYPYFVRDFVAAGHEVGNHTYHHVRLTELADSEVRAELSQCNAVLSGITGRPVVYFRPPGGRYSPTTLQLAGEAGLITTFWTDDPADFDNLGQAVLTSRLSEHLRKGGIVLLHDNVLQSVAVLPRFLAFARQQRVRIETVGQLAQG